MDKVVAYLLEKETITGGEMVAIIEGRDPALVEDAYASTRKAIPGDIEPPAKAIHIVSEEIKNPALTEGEEPPAEPEEPPKEEEKPQEEPVPAEQPPADEEEKPE